MKNDTLALLLLGAILAVAGLVWFMPSLLSEIDTPGEPVESRAPERLPPKEAVAKPPAAQQRESVPADESTTETPADAKLAVFRGRCVDVAGRPVEGATASLHGFRANRERMDAYVSKHGEVVWQDPGIQTTGPDGRFEIRVAPPPPYQFSLTVGATGCVEVTGRWSKVEPGGVKDFGDCTLVHGCEVRGRVTDSNGLPRDRVSVNLERLKQRGGFDEDVLRARQWASARTKSDGTFRLRTLVAVGKWKFELNREEMRSPAEIEIHETDRSRFFELKVRPKADIVTIQGVLVDESGQPVRGQVSASTNRYMGGRDFYSKRDGTFVIERQRGQGEEPVRLHAEGRGLERVSTEKTYGWGTTGVRLVIRRGASIWVVVTDAGSGDPVEEYGVRLMQAGHEWRVRSSMDAGIRARGKHDGGRAELTGLRRGEYRFRIEPTGGGWSASAYRTVMVGEAHPGEVRFALVKPCARKLKVVTADSSPVAGTKVELLEAVQGKPIDLRTFANRMDGSSTNDPNQATVLCEGKTGRDGEFELRGPAGRSLGLRILGPGHLPRVVRDVVLDSGTGPIVVTVPLGATVFGRIRPAKILSQMRAMAGENEHARKKKPGIQFSRGRESFPAGIGKWFPLREDGSFEVTGIGSGTWSVTMWWQKAHGDSSSGSKTLSLGQIEGLKEGERREFDLDLSAKVFARVTGKIFIGDKPYRGQVVFYKAGQWSDSAMSNEKGEFSAFVGPGSYRVRAGNLYADESVSLSPGEETSREFHATVVTIRLRVLGPDGEPRVGVRVLVVDESSKISFRLDPSDKNGHAEGRVSPGAYDLMVMPKRLTDQEALMKFYEENRRDPAALSRARVQLDSVRITIGPKDRIEVRLPAAAGY